MAWLWVCDVLDDGNGSDQQLRLWVGGEVGDELRMRMSEASDFSSSRSQIRGFSGIQGSLQWARSLCEDTNAERNHFEYRTQPLAPFGLPMPPLWLRGGCQHSQIFDLCPDTSQEIWTSGVLGVELD